MQDQVTQVAQRLVDGGCADSAVKQNRLFEERIYMMKKSIESDYHAKISQIQNKLESIEELKVQYMTLKADVQERCYDYELRNLHETLEKEYTTVVKYQALCDEVETKATKLELGTTQLRVTKQEATIKGLDERYAERMDQIEDRLEGHDKRFDLTQEGVASNKEGVTKAIDDANSKIAHLEHVSKVRNEESLLKLSWV